MDLQKKIEDLKSVEELVQQHPGLNRWINDIVRYRVEERLRWEDVKIQRSKTHASMYQFYFENRDKINEETKT